MRSNIHISHVSAYACPPSADDDIVLAIRGSCGGARAFEEITVTEAEAVIFQLQRAVAAIRNVHTVPA